MMQELTIQIPTILVEKLEQQNEDISQLVLQRLERKVMAQSMEPKAVVPSQVYRYVMEFLVTKPTPEELMAFGPAPAMQERMSTLLTYNRERGLSSEESAELDEYLQIDHLITMIKAGALPYLTKSP